MTQTITIKDPKSPATQPQLNFLANLVKDRDDAATIERYQLAMSLGFLSKGNASKMIDALTKAPKKATTTGTFVVEHPPLQQVAKSAQQAAEKVAATLTEMPTFGYYQVGETLYHWDVTGKDHKPTLRRLYVVTNYNGTKKGSWKKVGSYATGFSPVKVTGTWTPYNGKGYNKSAVTTAAWVPGTIVKAVQDGIKPLTQAEAATLGKAYTFCIRCGATLTDPVSVGDGIGPVCKTYGYWG